MTRPDCNFALVQDRPPGEDEQTWELSRFTPMLQEVIEDLISGSLSSDEYPHVRPPHAASNGRFNVQIAFRQRLESTLCKA